MSECCDSFRTAGRAKELRNLIELRRLARPLERRAVGLGGHPNNHLE